MKSKLIQLIKILPKNAFATIKRRKYNSTAPMYSLFDGLKFTQIHSTANFDENLDIALILNVDPKRGDQLVRGSCTMPSGMGKTVKVAIHCEPKLHELAKAAGADLIVTNQTFEDIKKYQFDFDKLITTNACINDIKPLAKILGPRGLMPNPKSGTLIQDSKLEETIRNAKVGHIEFRVDNGGTVHVSLGKAYFTKDQILKNLKSLMEELYAKKPANIRGSFVLATYLSTTMGPSFRVDPTAIDPKAKSYLLKNY